MLRRMIVIAVDKTRTYIH